MPRGAERVPDIWQRRGQSGDLRLFHTWAHLSLLVTGTAEARSTAQTQSLGVKLGGEPVLWASLSLSPGPCPPAPMLFAWGIEAGLRAFPGWELGSQLGWGSPLGPWS